MNAPEMKTLADPMFANIFNTAVVEPYDADAVKQALINHGEKIMREHIVCTTTEEHNHDTAPSTTILNPSSPTETQIIQGVSGQNYAPMDTSPKPPTSRLDELTNLLNETLKQIVIELTNSKDQQTNLAETVSTALEQAQWFKDRVEEGCAWAVENHDFEYEVGTAVERYMRNEFDANDHYDFDTGVKAFVEDEIESIIDGLVADAVEARLADLLEEKLANAKITINF